MGNDILAVASMEVSVAASFSDDYCSIEVAISFRLDLIIFSRLPESAGKSRGTRSLKFDTKEYLEEETRNLKNICDEWESYVDGLAKSFNGKVFNSVDDLKEAMKEIVYKQADLRDRVEKIIRKVHTALTGSTLTADQTEATLKFLSNCFQVIRDLYLSVSVADLGALELDIGCTDSMELIREEILRDYSAHKIITKIKKRSELSQRLIQNGKTINELKTELKEHGDALLRAAGKSVLETKKKECRDGVKGLIKEAVADFNGMMRENVQFRLDILNCEIAGYEKRIKELSADNGLFSKKKSALAAETIGNFLKEAVSEKDELEKMLQNCEPSVSMADFCALFVSNPIQETVTGVEGDIAYKRERLQRLEEEQKLLTAEYETIVKNFIDPCAN